MLGLISVLLALGINFSIPENNKSLVINKKYYQKIGFPYQYFEGEVLTDEEVNYRIRLIYISIMMYFTIAYSVVPTVGPVVGQVLLPLPPTSLEKLIPNQLDSQTTSIGQTAPVISNRPDKIIYTEEQINESFQISFEFLDGSITMEKAILKLRGGGNFKDISFIVLYIWLWKLQNNHVRGFQQIHPPHREWMAGSGTRPPQQGNPSRARSYRNTATQQNAKLKSVRNEANPGDIHIRVPGHRNLVIRHGQAKKKLTKHGGLYNTVTHITETGNEVSAKPKENQNIFKKGIQDLVTDPSSTWYDKGTYQASTERGFNSVNVFDEKRQIVVVFKRQTGEFVTTYKLLDWEASLLKRTGNVGGVKEENAVNYMGNTADSMTDVPDSISSTPVFPIDNTI